MTSPKNECSGLKDIIPLYVKGLLPESQRAKVEAARGHCPELEAEIAYWRDIESAYASISRSMPDPSPRVYQKITERVKKPGLLSRLIPSPRIAFALATVQLLIILSLGFYIVQQKTEYRTMSAISEEARGVVMINVVFDEQATESEIRGLLLKTDGRIVDGPSSAGLYILEYPSPEQARSALEVLRESNRVQIAEKKY